MEIAITRSPNEILIDDLKTITIKKYWKLPVNFFSYTRSISGNAMTLYLYLCERATFSILNGCPFLLIETSIIAQKCDMFVTNVCLKLQELIDKQKIVIFTADGETHKHRKRFAFIPKLFEESELEYLAETISKLTPNYDKETLIGIFRSCL